MAKQFRVEIDGNPIANVLDVEYGLDVAKDSNGAPVDARPRLKAITLTRRSDENTDLWAWSLHPHSEYFKSGKIEFLDPKHEDKVLTTLEWTDGFVRSYREIVPHVDSHRNDPQTECVEVSAAEITINGVQWKGAGTWI